MVKRNSTSIHVWDIVYNAFSDMNELTIIINRKMILVKILMFILFLFSCDMILKEDNYSEVQNSLNIKDIWKQSDPLEKDSNGYYHFLYSPTGISESDYGTVKYITEIPVTRVFWSSPDSFYIYHINQWIGEPIINFSTYSDEDGFGNQLFYIHSNFIGDTLRIYGEINSNLSDSVFVIIEL